MPGWRSMGYRTITGWAGRMRYCPSTWSHIFRNAFRLVRWRALAMSSRRRRTAFFGWTESNRLVTSSMSILEYQTFRKRIVA